MNYKLIWTSRLYGETEYVPTSESDSLAVSNTLSALGYHSERVPLAGD